jgi:DNA replication and repair protein RecF
MISPVDERLIVETGDTRRRFMDSVISQFDKTYLEYLIRYNRALTQRNSLLKNWKNINENNIEQLEIWDNQLFVNGKVIFEKRLKFIHEIIPIFQDYYSRLSGKNEIVNITYHSHFNKEDYLALLNENRERDIALGYTSKGIHRDDIELLMNNYLVRQDGSQGQKKSFLIALKLAQYDFLYACNDFSPILLLDDIFDKLDDQRGSSLINLLEQPRFKQILITDTQKERLNDIVKKTGRDFSFFEVNDGNINYIITN